MSSSSVYLLFVCSGLITHPQWLFALVLQMNVSGNAIYFMSGQPWAQQGPIWVQCFKPCHNLSMESMAATKASRQNLLSTQAHSLPYPWWGVQVGIPGMSFTAPKKEFYSLKWLQFKGVWMCVCVWRWNNLQSFFECFLCERLKWLLFSFLTDNQHWHSKLMQNSHLSISLCCLALCLPRLK